MSTRNRAACVLLSVALFLLCLTQEAYYIETTDQGAPAWQLFCLGFLGIAEGIFAWFANPLLIAAWVLLAIRQQAIALVAGATAVLLALSFMAVETILTAGPTHARVTGTGPGYWLWLASMAAVVAGAAWALLSPTPQESPL